MNKLIKYGVVAGLTMASFSLAGVPVHAAEAATANCGGTLSVASGTEQNDTVVIAREATTCVLKFKFKNTLENNGGAEGPEANVGTASIEGLEVSVPGSSRDYTESFRNGPSTTDTATITLTEAGIAKIRAAGRTGVTMTVKDNTETFTTQLIVEPVELTTVEAEIVDGVITNFKYNEGYESHDNLPTISYSVDAAYVGIVSVSADGRIAVAKDYVTAYDRNVTITVTATDGEHIATTTVKYTIAANYTEVRAGFGAEMAQSAEVTGAGDYQIYATEVDGVDYEYELVCDGDICEYIELDTRTGKVTVKAGYVLLEDVSVTVKVRGYKMTTLGEGLTMRGALIGEKELTLTVKANFVMSATFDDGIDEKATTVSQGAKIKTSAADGVRYEYTCEGDACWYITIDENGNVTIDPSYASWSDSKVKIIVKAFAGDVELGTKELILNIAANLRQEMAEVIAGAEFEYEAGSDKTPSFATDVKDGKLDSIWLYGKTLGERYSKMLNEDGLSYEEARKAFTDFEWQLIMGGYWLEEGDYTIDEDGNIVLSADLMAKLGAGEYAIYFHYYNDADVDDKFWTEASTTFTVVDVEAPEAGAVTAEKAGATSSVLSTAVVAIVALGAAVVAKFAKRK